MARTHSNVTPTERLGRAQRESPAKKRKWTGLNGSRRYFSVSHRIHYEPAPL
jgi:hypothetical protein